MQAITKTILELGAPRVLKKEAEARLKIKHVLQQEKKSHSDGDIDKILDEHDALYGVHIDHYWLLTDLMLDFKTNSQLYFINLELTKATDAKGRSLDKGSHIRLHLTLAVIHYSKLNELIDSYGKYKNSLNQNTLIKELNDINKLIQESGIYSYRSQYIAHAFSKEKKVQTALHYKEGIEKIHEIFCKFTETDDATKLNDASAEKFYKKIYDGKNHSIVYLIHNFKEAIRSEKLYNYNINR
ncbi:hypothetical protein [Pseudomonas sp. Xaverov 259]|uniref:hypothetical protein n=1 Tax=Pseudomonas sp. Xaverov 259 TaxID=2666086 RepID=UPI001C5A81A4|nr:hypothetical protein [Pseudomonas sp. Xaverov 259]